MATVDNVTTVLTDLVDLSKDLKLITIYQDFALFPDNHQDSYLVVDPRDTSRILMNIRIDFDKSLRLVKNVTFVVLGRNLENSTLLGENLCYCVWRKILR